MDSNNLNGGVDAYGMDDARRPLLEPLDVSAADKRIRTLKFKIGEIHCTSCSTTIESVVGKLHGVRSVTVSPIQGQAAVAYIPELINGSKIKEAVEDAGFPVDEFPEQDIAVCRLRINGMMCTSCSESIESALRMVAGVKNAVVGLALEEAKVHFDPNITNTSLIIEAIDDAGFGSELISSGNDVNKVHLKLEGVNSPEDMTIIQSSLESVEGVNNAEVDVLEKKVSITYDADLTGPRSLIHCIEEAGSKPKSYQACLYVPPRRREAEQQLENRMYRNQFFLSCVFSVPVFLFSMVLPMLSPYGDWLMYKIHNMLTVGILLRWILCTPVQFIIGRRGRFL